MRHIAPKDAAELDAAETREWLDSLDYVLQSGGPAKVARLLRELTLHATAERRQAAVHRQHALHQHDLRRRAGADAGQPATSSAASRASSAGTPRRWSCAPTRPTDGIGGHISTFASAATLYEVGFNHFFRGKDDGGDGDVIFFQGHAAPGIYARAFLEGPPRRDAPRELPPRAEARRRPVVVPASVADARLLGVSRRCRWASARSWRSTRRASCATSRIAASSRSPTRKVWAFLGDGETDEPEALGAITLPAREKLDNLIFVINCNLQRLDGPVRGNGQIIQELEAAFRGAGWNVIKVLWGREWDPLLAKDRDGLLVKRMGEIVDGQYQKYAVESGAYVREHFWGADPRLLDMVKHLSDDQLKKLTLGGHDPVKVYNAYKAAVEHKGAPTVILARTIKGYGLGEAGEGKNITHQQKKMNEEELRAFRTRFGIPISDADIAQDARSTGPPTTASRSSTCASAARRSAASCRRRKVRSRAAASRSPRELFEEFYKGTDGRKASTTMVFVRLLSKLLRDKDIGQLVVPIVPDEARTFGMEALFRQVGIYSHAGQLYEPVDMDTLLYYKEASDGQILEEGITEAGSMSSFIAAGTAYATHGVNTIPFFIYYSMFGFQRIGDLIWAAGRLARRAASCSAAPPAARRWPAKGCSTRTATATCSRWPCPELSSPTTRRSPTSSPSSSRTASAGCTSIRRASSTT